MTRPKLCYCEAYKFPHRRYSGKCYAAEDELESAKREEDAERWWLRKFGHYQPGSTAGPMGGKR